MGNGGAKRDDLNLMSLDRPNFSKLGSFGKEFYQESAIAANRSQVT